ncbi:hypothetical protein [Microvirga sp. VF16]|uniref:hypothetical protein n=1 Tax=Microvirga sp. VF16 TaxID=2807101 RepID=UPI00193D053F|nr:hypothetical protein [Microvirga sp. VF16]QRM34909.1 hypothetical protein JO965_42375 [Microvirga sp. VF16]
MGRTIRIVITADQYNTIAQQHAALKGQTRFFADSIHVYKEGNSVVRQTYSHTNHGLPSVEEVCREGEAVSYRQLVHQFDPAEGAGL